MLVAGFDPGVAHAAIAVVRRRGTTFELVWHAEVQTAAAAPMAERFGEVTRSLDEWVRHGRELGVSRLGIERQVKALQGHRERTSTNFQALHVLEVKGRIEGIAHAHGVPTMEVDPQDARDAVGAPRTGKKALVGAAVRRIVQGLPTRSTEHLRDAAAVAVATLRRVEHEARLAAVRTAGADRP